MCPRKFYLYVVFMKFVIQYLAHRVTKKVFTGMAVICFLKNISISFITFWKKIQDRQKIHELVFETYL